VSSQLLWSHWLRRGDQAFCGPDRWAGLGFGEDSGEEL